MPAPNTALVGEELLTAVSDAMLAFHERYYHRRPGTAKSLLMEGDLLVCVLGGVYTEVEKTMIELQRAAMVRDTRSAFQQTVQTGYIKTVERLSGREVLTFISEHHVGPDVEVELFFLGARNGPEHAQK